MWFDSADHSGESLLGYAGLLPSTSAPELRTGTTRSYRNSRSASRSAQVRASRPRIGAIIALLEYLLAGSNQKDGAKVIDRLAKDLLQAFPGMTGFGA